MKALFDQIVAGGERELDQMIQDKRQENVSLEFKTKADRGHGAFDQKDKENLAKTLSALSNSGGGLLIWGLDARKDSTGIDAAAKLDPISNIARFKSDALRLIPDALRPMNDGVRVEAIHTEQAADTGYLLIEVQRSERRPHRSEFGAKYYYKRVAGSSLAMEHYDVEDAFKRTSIADLEVALDYESGGQRRSARPDGNYNKLGVILLLTNNSHHTARDPYVRITSGHLQNVVVYNNINNEAHDGWTTFSISPGGVIHPGTKKRIVKWTREIPVTITSGRFERIHPIEVQSYSVPFELGCFDSRMKTGAVEVNLQKACRELYPHTPIE